MALPIWDRMARKRDMERMLRKKYPERYSAKDKVRYALRTGRLTRRPCEVCGNPKVEFHHPDYSKPIEGRWLCKKHHEAAHHQPTTPAASASSSPR